MEVDVIQSYGDSPDREEIKDSINTAQDNGYTLHHTDSYGASLGTEPDVCHVVILYFEEVQE